MDVHFLKGGTRLDVKNHTSFLMGGGEMEPVIIKKQSPSKWAAAVKPRNLCASSSISHLLIKWARVSLKACSLSAESLEKCVTNKKKKGKNKENKKNQ